MSKADKASVDYSEGMPKSHCGICRHFEPPHSCRKVAGHIDKKMWCRLFAKMSSRDEKIEARYGK